MAAILPRPQWIKTLWKQIMLCSTYCNAVLLSYEQQAPSNKLWKFSKWDIYIYICIYTCIYNTYFVLFLLLLLLLLSLLVVLFQTVCTLQIILQIVSAMHVESCSCSPSFGDMDKWNLLWNQELRNFPFTDIDKYRLKRKKKIKVVRRYFIKWKFVLFRSVVRSVSFLIGQVSIINWACFVHHQ